MRILRVAQTCYPEVTGGGAYHVHAMSRDQAALGHDVTVLTVRQEPDTPGLEGRDSPHVEERDGYTVVRFDPTASPLGNDCSAGLARYLHWATADGARRLGSAVGHRRLGSAVGHRRQGSADGDRFRGSAGGDRHLGSAGGLAHFDVVHAHSHLYAATNLAALERWLGAGSPARRIRSLLGAGSHREAAFEADRPTGAAPPLAITNHGLYSQAVPERAFDWYLRSVGRWTLDTADVVLCYTDVDRRRLRELGVATDVAVVPNGVDTERFSPEGPEYPPVASCGAADERPGDDGPAVLFVGRLVEGKRPADAIAAIERVRESVPDATLYVCGDGPLRAELEAMAAERVDAGAGDGVVFLGHLEYDEMPSVYRAADVLALPSRTEGMPRTVLEARASGTPVVASDLEQLRSLDDGGIRTVPLGDVDALAAAIVEVLAAGADQPSSQVVGGRPSIADGGSDRTTMPNEADDRPAVQGDAPDADEPPPRSAYDWTTTVRRTTDVLRDLSEGSR